MPLYQAVKYKDIDDWTFLHFAAQGNDYSWRCIKPFLELGAVVNAETKDGQTPLKLAVDSCNPEAIEVLVANKADQGRIFQDPETDPRWLAEDEEQWAEADKVNKEQLAKCWPKKLRTPEIVYQK